MRRSPHEILNDVVERIERATNSTAQSQGPKSLTCCCPAHEDSTPSLSVSIGRQAVVMHCHAGCEPDDIAERIGLSLAEMFFDWDPEQANHGNGATQSRKGAKNGRKGRRTATAAAQERGTTTTQRPKREPQPSADLTVAELAAERMIPEQMLRDWGVEDQDGTVRINYYHADGTPAPRARLRRGPGDAKFRWAGTSEDGPLIAYGLWMDLAASAPDCILLVEGETDCWPLWATSIRTLGVPGASLAKVLEPEMFTGVRTVFVVDEKDAGGEKFVAGVRDRLHEIGVHADVRAVRLPAEIKDPSDLWQSVVADTHQDRADAFTQAMLDAIAAAEPVEPAAVEPPPSPPEVREDFDSESRGDLQKWSPAVVSEMFRAEARLPKRWGDEVADDGWHLVHHRDEFYRYDGRVYRHVPQGELRNRIAAFVRLGPDGGPRMWRKGKQDIQGDCTASFAGNVMLNLASHECVSSGLDTPVWSDGQPASRWLALKNGLLNLTKYIAAERDLNPIATDDCPDPYAEMRAALDPHSPELFTTTLLPYDYDPEAECPKWRTFLERVLPGEAERSIMQEWFGYCLTPSQAYQRILIIQGEGQNGKSVLSDVLEQMVGKVNCSAVPLEMLHLPHATEPLQGKLLNFASEWAWVEAAGLSTLKAISGGDSVLINPKNRKAFEVKLPTRFVVSTNEPPRVHDKSDAIWRRLITIPFNVRIPDDEKKPKEPFVAELCTELPGILRWALEGWARLIKRGDFQESDVTRAVKAEYREDANPARTFCDEQIAVLPPGGYSVFPTPCGTIYTAYANWCHDNGYKPLNQTHFGRVLKKWALPLLFPDPNTPEAAERIVKKKKRTIEDGRKANCYTRLGLASDREDEGGGY
jgi:P4 family phage/plasmid primase-like protien